MERGKTPSLSFFPLTLGVQFSGVATRYDGLGYAAQTLLVNKLTLPFSITTNKK